MIEYNEFITQSEKYEYNRTHTNGNIPRKIEKLYRYDRD